MHQRWLRAAILTSQGLHLSYGALHPEFLLTPQGELILIDVGGRPAGAGLPMLARDLGAMDEITMVLYSCFAPEKFREIQLEGPRLPVEGIQVYLINDRAGTVTSVADEAEIRKNLPGVDRWDLHLKMGHVLGQSHNLFDSPGWFFAKGGETEQDSFRDRVRAWEAEGFYRISAGEPKR